MSIVEAVLFGLAQGLTEFIPISSTAHMVILGYILETPTPGLFSSVSNLPSVSHSTCPRVWLP